MRLLLSLVSISLLMTGCANISLQKIAPGEAPVVVGPAVRENVTPVDTAMFCYNKKLAAKLAGKKLQIAVGEIKDYTGKVAESQGTMITQGGSLMLFSGLYKLKDAITVHDRYDTRVTDTELRYIGLKQLGDGANHDVNGQTVPWLPYFGGSVKKSDYTILGGITEMNFNIQSGGAEFRVNQIGPAARVYTMNVAVDLRLVNTKTLEVVSAVSLQKQFTGYEIGFELFRFYGHNGGAKLFDVNIGNKSQEPLQLGVRAIIEESILRLVSDVTGVAYNDCLSDVWMYPEKQKMVRSQLVAPLPAVSEDKEKTEGAPTAESATAAEKSQEQVKDGVKEQGAAVPPAQSDAAPGQATKQQMPDSAADTSKSTLTEEDKNLTPSQKIKKITEQYKQPTPGNVEHPKPVQ